MWKLSFRDTEPVEELEAKLSRAMHELDSQGFEVSLDSPDPFTRTTIRSLIPNDKNEEQLLAAFSVEDRQSSTGSRLSVLENARDYAHKTAPTSLLKKALQDPSPDVRLYAVRWIADERIKALRDDVAKLLDGELPTERYYLSVLAAVDWLDGNGGPHDKALADRVLVSEMMNPNRRPAIHALALRLLSPDSEYLNANTLGKLLKSGHAELRLEAVRTLASQQAGYRFAKLAEIAANADNDANLRCEAIAGLSGSRLANDFELLAQLASDSDATVAGEAARVLRLARIVPMPLEAVETKPDPKNTHAWSKLLAEAPGNAESGRRLFFSKVGPQCAACHQHGGRGGRVGPDLTRIASTTAREKILESILQPSKEVAPRYTPWVLHTEDGKTHLGLKMAQGGDSGAANYSNAEGKLFNLKNEEIEMREPSDVSVMPAGLEKTLSVEDFRDLLAFLSGESNTSE